MKRIPAARAVIFRLRFKYLMALRWPLVLETSWGEWINILPPVVAQAIEGTFPSTKKRCRERGIREKVVLLE
jgi:hypothetical protein